MKIRRVCAIAALSVLFPVLQAAATADDSDENSAETKSEVLVKFLEATQNDEDALRGASMQVNIDASIPKLKEHGTLKVLRKISRVGTISYQMLGFQGDNTVKKEVIVRYLQAEQQGQGDQKLAITPDNYKFKSKGDKRTDSGSVYVFQLTPRKNKVGLFKGEMWLDSKTYLPVMEKGKLVKNPSIWFKKVEFERDFAVKDGVSVPQHMSSTIDVRLFGKVQLNIDYSNYERTTDVQDNAGPQSLLETAVASK